MRSMLCPATCSSPGANVDIRNNPRLAHIDGLSSLERVNGQLVIYTNALLANVNGLSKLNRVGTRSSTSMPTPRSPASCCRR